MYLMAPLFAGSGLVGSFITANFTSDVIKPNLGAAQVPCVMMLNGAASAIASVVLGRISDKIGRPSVMALGMLSYVYLIVSLWMFP